MRALSSDTDNDSTSTFSNRYAPLTVCEDFAVCNLGPFLLRFTVVEPELGGSLHYGRKEAAIWRSLAAFQN